MSALINLEAQLFESVRLAGARSAASHGSPILARQSSRLKVLQQELAMLEAARGGALPEDYEPASAELTQVVATNHKLKYQLNHLKKVCAAERAGSL